jgi:hypothetical protein
VHELTTWPSGSDRTGFLSQLNYLCDHRQVTNMAKLKLCFGRGQEFAMFGHVLGL